MYFMCALQKRIITTHTPSTLFDVNGCIGYSSSGASEFPTADALLRQLDSLGVHRSLVWHVSARDVNPTWGNERLIDEISLTSEAEERLIPAFVIGASVLHERDGLERLRSGMLHKKVRALRLFPTKLNHSLPEIESLIREVLEFQPVLLFDCRFIDSVDALGQLADTFSQVPIIYTNVSWPQIGGAFHLLSRHSNILVDLSWLHTCGTAEKIVRDFGSHRLIFGLGNKANHGASILELFDMPVSQEAKEQIGHQNLENVLHLGSSNGLSPNHNQKGKLWNQLLSGIPCSTEVLDAHGHLGPWGTWMIEAQQIEDQIADIIPRMNRLGIGTMIVSGTQALMGEPVAGNYLLKESCRPHSGRFLGYVVFNPNYHEELTSCFQEFFTDDFFVGFKVLNSYWKIPVTDPRHEAMWKYANHYRLPILLHTWNDDYDHPDMLEGITGEYPDAKFILGHSGGTDEGRSAALRLALKRENVYLEWCGSFQMTKPFEELITCLGKERIIFGTDATLHSPAWELGRFLSLDLSDEMLIPALGKNMRTILGQRLMKL